MTRRTALLAAAALLLAGGLWLAAARWLWPTTVPAGLRLTDLDPARFFSRSFLARAASYQRFSSIDALLGQTVLLAVLVVYARQGHRLMSQSAAGPIGTGMLLGMLGFGVVWIAELPFGLAAVWWERRHHVSHQGYVRFALDGFLALGGRFLFVSLALVIAMGLARALRGWWWLVATPLFGALALLAAFLTIYLTPSVHPLRDRALLAQAAALARREGVPATRVEVQEVSRETTQPNAEAVGFGPTRRVILWDTLLTGRFRPAEVRTVVAHELGHVAHRHILRGVAWLALFLIPTAGLVALVTRSVGGMADPRAVPVALLVAAAVGFVLAPAREVISRRMEAEADWSALSATHDPTADRTLMRRLALRSLSDPDPPTWSYVLQASHPTIMQRIAMADAWQRLHDTGRLRSHDTGRQRQPTPAHGASSGPAA